MDDTVETPADPGQYTLLLGENGTATVQSDCSSRGGSYEIDGSQLDFSQFATTMMGCPPPSLADVYIGSPATATSYVLEDGNLYIAFGPDAGILHFAPAESAAEGTATLPEEPTAQSIIEATFVCPDGTRINAVFDNAADTVTITLSDEMLTLPRAVSGSGARYSDDTTTFWNQGDEALVEVNGEIVYQGCVAQE